jgi:hypothetical protein
MIAPTILVKMEANVRTKWQTMFASASDGILAKTANLVGISSVTICFIF